MRNPFRRFLRFAMLVTALALSSCGERAPDVTREAPPNTAPQSGSSAPVVPLDTYEVVKAWPHDSSAYTQGLEFYRGVLYESTGLYGRSSLRKVDLETGRILQKRDLATEYFGEGITIFQGKIFQLTWRSQKGFIYDLGTFNPLGEFSYSGEGWGLTHDDHFLIMSDGTNQIHFLDPASFQVKRTLSVLSDGQPLMNLNELEMVKGEIYANVYETNYIVRIDPASGKILGWIDLTGLLAAADRRQPVDVLNGIAYDASQDRLVVTGKLWPKLFQIRLVRK